jgi:hypothetical protein
LRSTNTIARLELGNFLKLWLLGHSTQLLWEKYAVNHYGDNLMENIRQRFVQIALEARQPYSLTQEQLDELESLSARLRLQ